MYYFNYTQKRPSFLIGIARILDITISLSPQKKLYNSNPEFRDFEAIYSDWKSIGDDIRGVIGGSTSLLSK